MPSRSSVVVWAVTGLASLVMVCMTVLVALDRIEGTAFVAIIGSFLAPVVMILLSVQQQATDRKVDQVREQVNGHMTSLISRIPPTRED